MRDTYDVVIVGGAMMGASIAWWLSRSGGLRIAVVEADPSYALASTSHSNSCVRQQFGCEINVKASQFCAEFISQFQEHMGADAPRIPIQNFGYLYLAQSEAGCAALRANHAVQSQLGVATRLMTADEIRAAYPFYQLDDIKLGSHNTVDEGYFDGGTIFDHFRKASKAAGVHYITGRVAGLEHSGGRITAALLESGARLACGAVVNAAGPRAAQVARMAGLDLPVEPRKRFTFVFDAAEPLDRPLPLTIDPSGVHVRTDGRYYMAGCPPDEDAPVEPDDFSMDHHIWETKVWPAIATRIPAFERIKLVQEWVGHYAYNTLDQNAILGLHPAVENLYFANGFSGHGLQQAPAVGRGIAELIQHGAYQTLDLSDLSWQRVLEERPLIEPNVI